MQELPLVSIVTCSYNNSEFVIETLESIKNQTYSNIELIIVDDCSTDNSVELINGWLEGYKGKYKFICHEKNLGGSRPYNIGLQNTTGKYYCTIDSDDTLLPEKTATQVAILEASSEDVAAVYSDVNLMDVKGAPLNRLFIEWHRKFSEVPSGNIYNELLLGNYIPIMSLLIKRAVLNDVGMFDESLIYGDYDLWLRIAKKYSFIFMKGLTANYRIRPGSLSHTTKNWVYSDAKIFLKHTDALLPAERLMNLAFEAYITEDKDTLILVDDLADKTNNDFLKVAFKLWKLKIPLVEGRKVLEKLNENNTSIWYRKG
ncbi:MAG: glycosyltransferase [Flavipsychrobacter sp.]|nr:glycosyltransferase [Flavipsychrobacter sp.]